jgi:hypothetical protein
MFVFIILAAAEKQHQTPVTPVGNHVGNKRHKFNAKTLDRLIKQCSNSYISKLLPPVKEKKSHLRAKKIGHQ